jgi:hypothetical protein
MLTRHNSILIIIVLFLTFSYLPFEKSMITSAVGEITTNQNQVLQQDTKTESSNFTDSPAVIAAIIAACASVSGVVLTNYFGKRNQKDLAKLQEQSDIKKI